MSLLDKYTEKYGNREQVNRLRKSKEWMPETPTSPEKESNRAAAHSLIDNMTDEDRKRIESNGPLGKSLGMQTNGILGNAFASIFNKEEAKKNKNYQTYKAASDILQAEKYEKKREDVVRQNGSYAYKTMKNYIDLIDKARQSRQGGGTLGALINSGKTEDLQKQAKEIKKTLEQMGITGKDFDKYEQYVREYKDIEDTQAMEKEIASKVAAKPVARGIGYTAADVAVSPITGLVATAESLKRPFYADPLAPVNTYSSLYALQNASNAVEQSVSNQIDSKLGKFAYGTGVSALKSGEAMLIGNYLGGAFGIDAASKLGQLTTLPMFGASAFAQTLQESQAKGFSPEMATQKALASGMAEMLFEELSLDKAWGTLKNAKLGKGGLSKRILDVFMGAGIEGSEEIFTDLANHIADNFINGDFSDYQSGIRMRVENGMSLDQATREAKKEFIAQLVESGLAGAASGGFMNVAAASVGSVQYHNTARNINENSKLKTEVVESAKGLEGTTAAEIANNKSVEEINENDMVEILHSMEEVTQKSAHDIAKESLMSAGETAEEAEKKANEIVIMSEQTQPTEAEEKRNIDLVKDENVANAYADVLKNRVASNVLEDVEKHNAEVKKIKDRVKGKEGIKAGYNNQEIKVYDFEDVQKGIVATSQGLLDLSEITLPDDMRLLFKNAHALENTKAANAFIDGYKGQSPSYYATGSLRAFMVGASGGSWESFINSKNPLNIKLIEEIGDNAYLKSMYFYGQNSRENAEAAKVETSKINPGKVTGENVLNPLLEPLAKKFNVAINTTEGRNKAAGSFVPSELLVTLNKAESNNMLNSVLHETLGEYTKAYAPDAYKLTKQKVIDFARKVFGDTEVDRQIRVYQNTYKGFGKQTGNTAESNKTFADASDEWFNDFMAGLAQTEYGLERVVNYVAEDNSMTATEKTSVLQSIKDIVKKILDTIKSYLQGIKSNNIGTKAAKEVEKNIDKYMADLEDIFNAVEKMCDAAIAEVNKQINGETKVEEKSETKEAHSLNVDSEGNNLTEAQVKYFADSKVRDSEGRLLKVMHGTEADFTVFNPKESGGKNGTAEGFGIYFSDDAEVTKHYGDRQLEGYLNITKPAYDNKKTITMPGFIKLLKATTEYEAKKWDMDIKDTWISNYEDTYSNSLDAAYRSVAKQILEANDNDKDIIQEVMVGMGIRNYNQAYEFYDVLKKTLGFDGFSVKWTHADGTSNVYVALDSNQFKLIDNVDPTENEDIRYSLNVGEDIEKWFKTTEAAERKKQGGFFYLGKTTEPLKLIGLADKTIKLGKSKIQEILDKHEEMSESDIVGIVDLINRPMVILSSKTDPKHSIVLFGERTVKNENGKLMPVMASVKISTEDGEIEDYVVTSAYGRPVNQLQYMLNNERIFYIEPQKNKTDAWLSALRVQFPSASIKYGLNKKIPQSMLNVKKEQKSDIKHSLNVDSQGSSLSPEQAEFFKDSKARDDEGRLLVMYHGTDAYKDFTVFKPGKNGYLGKGMYFTEKKYIAQKYAEQNGYDGRVYQVYLNVKNPLVVTSDNPALEILGEKVAAKRAMENSYSTRWLKPGDISKLKAKGYDGIIWKYGKSPIEISVWEPNQVKNTDNLKPTENEDIRYSLDVEDWEKDFFAEMTGNANVSNILTEGLKSLDNIKLNKKITDKIAREVREEYKSRIKVADLSDSLEKVFSYMLDTGAPSYGDLVNIMKEVAMPVVAQATEIMPEEKRIWDDFKEKMKGYRIKLNPQQKAEVANTFGTYYAFKNDMFGNLIFSESGTDLDSIWTEICDASGGYLDYAENPANQPMALYEFVEALKPTPANIYGANQEEAAYDVALTIFRKFLVEQEYENNPKLRKEALKLTEAQQTYKKRIKENYDKKFKEATESLRREKEINMKRLATEIKYLNEEEKAAIEGSIEQALILRQKRQYEWRLQKLRETKNDEINRKLSELKARQRASISRRVEGRQLTLAKAKIRKNVEKLNSMLAHGTENRHIPKNMVLSTIAMLESIDINTGNSKGMAEYLQKMEDIYRGFKDNDVYTDGEKAASFDYDERTAANIEALRKLFDGRNYTQLSLSELQQVIDITNAVITQAENANKLLGKEKREYATDVARAAALEVRNAKVKDSKFMTNLDHYMTQHLNAYREFRKLSGYEDGKLMDLYYDLDKGQQKQLQVMKDINAIFDDVLKDSKEVKRLTSTDKKDLVDSGLKDENGKPVMITRAERLSLIMHSYNKSNMQHLLYGGISVPDLSYKDPKQQRAHAKTYYYESQMELRDAILDKNANKLDLIEQRATMKVKELEKQLSPWEKQFLEATKEMFWKTTGRLINETSLELKGYTLARVANYFPIKTDTDYTKSDVSGLIFDGTIEGMGFLKERRFGRNAMMLEDITDTILRQTQSVAKYVGLAIPVRNFNMVWNTVTRSPMGNADTLKKAISLTWGAKNTDYIVNLMKDLNGRRDGGEPSAFDTLRGRFAGAVLTLNPSVAIKQAASYFTAGAKVGNLTLAKTLKDLGKGFILKKGIPELEAINPLLWYRNQGNATQELADMKAVGFGKNLPIWAQKALNWVEFMDTGTVRTLEYAAKNYVDANFKDLKGAEYWQKVSDVFTSIVEETQPNYTVLQQADIIRNPNRLLKAVVMFKTQPLQNFGTVYDAVGEYAAKVRKGNKAEIKEAGKHLAWALSSQIASAVTFSAMTILADMILHKQYKYKDDDKSFWEMVLAKFGAGLRDCFLGAVLAAKELYDCIEYLANWDKKTYYGLDVSALSQIGDIVKAVRNLGEDTAKRFNAITEADRDKYNQGILIDVGNVINYAGQFTGVPLGNVKNMFQSLILYAIDISNGTIGEAELSREVPNQYERMYEALDENDSDRYKKLFDEIITKKMKDAAEDGKEKTQEDLEKSVVTSMKKYIQDGYNSGELTYDEAYTILTKEFGMEEDDAYFKLDEWLYKSEGHEDYTRYIRLSDAVNGQGDIQAEIDKLKAQGIEEDTIKSQLTGILKEGYYKGSLSNEKITQVLKEYEDLTENDIYYKFKEWDFKKTHPDESFSRYDAMNNAIKEVINGSDNRKPMIAEIEDLMKHGVEAKSLQSQLTKEYKPLYLELKAKGKASTLKNILISAYMATGLSQEDAAKRIDRWKENDK